MMSTDEIAATCDISRWTGAGDRCRWCDRPTIAGRDFCGIECRSAFRVNHVPAVARAAALARGGYSCAACWRGPAALALLKLLMPACDWRRPPAAVAAELWALTASTTQVDHVVPVFGDRRPGCGNHLSNLRVLCRDCHLAETVRWARVRRAFRDAFGVDIAKVGPAPEPVRAGPPVAA